MPLLEAFGDHLVNQYAPLLRQHYEHASSVLRIWLALDEALLLQTIDSVRHGPARKERVSTQLANRLAKRWSTSTQDGEHVELWDKKVVRLQDLFNTAIQEAAQNHQPPEDAHR